jgi:hypothetical protein
MFQLEISNASNCLTFCIDTRKVPVRCHGHTNLNKITIIPKIMSHMMLINNVMQSIMTNIMVNIMHDVNPVTIDQ